MRIDVDTTVGIIVDVQERLTPVMDNWPATRDKTVLLIRGLRILGIPLLVTEQYPKGLGQTIPEVTTALAAAPPSGATPGATPIVKSAFSCCDEPQFMSALTLQHHSGRQTVIIAGIESHVCILQTTIDLLELGYQPVVVADATTSRNPLDRQIALQRLQQEGARLTTTESLLFELTRESGTPRFKEISRLIK